MTILHLRERLLPGIAMILLAACSSEPQPASDATPAADATAAPAPPVLPVEGPSAIAAAEASPVPAPSPSPSPSASASPKSVEAEAAPVPAAASQKIAVALAPPPAWARCAVCHSSEKGAAAKLGPNLYGVYGHKMGQGSYAFSDALKASGLTLDEATLDKWLENPRTLVPGNRMSFPGLKDPAKRAEIIAYLKQLN